MATDAWGLQLTGATAAASDAYDRTIDAYLAFGPDTGLRLKALLAAGPAMPLAHALRGCFFNLMGMPALLPKAKEALAEAQRHAADCTPRERLHLAALGAWCDGELEQAAATWDAILLDHPRDILALKLASYACFYLGDAASVRDGVARVLPAWDPAVPGYSYLLGMHAFGLEECGDYAAAERQGRRAIELNPADPWATHAVAHVLEMQDRCEEGIAWIAGLQAHWDRCNNFRYHLWWHRALMHLALEQYDEVLALYDRSLYDPQSEEYLDLCNDIALLARLEMAGIDVGGRWADLADKVRRQRAGHVLAFIDAHFVIATAATDGPAAAAAMVAELRTFAAAASGTTARVTADVGIALAEAMLAYRGGDYRGCVDKLYPVRRSLPRLGGSHAQRDLFVQMLVDAAMRCGRLEVARAMLAERMALRPANRWGRQRYAQVMAPFVASGQAAAPEPIPGTPAEWQPTIDARLDSEDRLRRIMNGLQIGVALTTPDGIVLEMNRAALNPAQLALEAVRGRKLDETPFCAGNPQAGRELAEAVRLAAAGTRVRRDMTVRMGARELPIDLTVAPVRDAAGRVVNVLVSAVDIEERKLAEDRLRGSEERYRQLFDGLAVPAYMYDLDSLDFLAVNAAAIAHYGYSRDEFLAMKLSAIRPPEDIGMLHERMRDVAQAAPGALLEMRLRHRRKNGEVIHVDLHIHRVDLEGRRTAIVSVLDVTERCRAEQEAASREQRLQAQALGMAALSRSDMLERSGLNASLREIVEIAAAALNVHRASVWLFDAPRTHIVSQVIYERDGGFLPNGTIAAADHPAYFAAVDTDRILSLADARTNEITASMVAAYLTVHGIGAMLDAPIVKLGRRVGVLCIEHKGGPRAWYPDEETFAMLAADFVGMVLEAEERLAAQRALQEYSSRLSALSGRLLQAQEAERRAVARELHDEIGQALTAVKVHLSVAARAPDRKAGERALDEAAEVVNTAIAQVRSKALDLRPSMLDDSGLVPALRWYVERFQQRSGIEVALSATIGERLPAPEQEAVCFRVIQEALTNVARHAQASAVSIRLERCEDGIRISIRDDGKGFDVAAARDRARHGEALGLAGMEERVRLIGGQIEIVSAHGAGCEIQVRVPSAAGPA